MTPVLTVARCLSRYDKPTTITSLAQTFHVRRTCLYRIMSCVHTLLFQLDQ